MVPICIRESLDRSPSLHAVGPQHAALNIRDVAHEALSVLKDVAGIVVHVNGRGNRLNRGQGIRVFIATCAAKDLYSIPKELYTLPGFTPKDVTPGSGEEEIPGSHSGRVPLSRQAPKVLQDSG